MGQKFEKNWLPPRFGNAFVAIKVVVIGVSLAWRITDAGQRQAMGRGGGLS
jgi:hypothetical protein